MRRPHMRPTEFWALFFPFLIGCLLVSGLKLAHANSLAAQIVGGALWFAYLILVLVQTSRFLPRNLAKQHNDVGRTSRLCRFLFVQPRYTAGSLGASGAPQMPGNGS